MDAGMAFESLCPLVDDDGPDWAKLDIPPIDYQDSYYYAAQNAEKLASLDEVDPELLATYEKLGHSLNEQKRLANVAVDAVFDSVSVATTFREELSKARGDLLSDFRGHRDYPELVKEIYGFGHSGGRQLFCRPEFRCLHRWLLCLHPEGRALPDGTVHLFQDK